MLFSVDGDTNRCVMVYMEVTPQPRTRVFLYDTTKGKGVFVEDTRIKMPMLPRVMLKEDALILAAFPTLGDPKLYHFDAQGKYDKVLDLKTFSGWKDNFSTVEVFNFNKDSLLLSVETLSFDPKHESEVFIMEVFWQERRMEILNQVKKKRPEYKIYWAPLGNNFLEVEGLTGKMSLVKNGSFTRSVLFKPLPIEMNEQAIMKMKKFSKVNSGAFNRASFKYHADWVIPQGPVLALQHSMPSVKTGKYEPMMVVLDQSGKVIRKGTQLQVWSTPQVTIFFDFEEGAFSLKSAPK